MIITYRSLIRSTVGAAVFFLLLILFFHPCIFSKKTISPISALSLDSLYRQLGSPARDFLIYDNSPYTLYLPFLRFDKDQLFSGSLPLWNPYMGCGRPHLGQFTSAPFSLPRLFYYFSPVNDDYSFFLIVKLMLCAGAMYLYCRHLKCSAPAAFFAAGIFAFNGYTMSSFYFLDAEAFLFFPLILLGIDLIWDSLHKLSAVLVLGLCEGLLILSGQHNVSYSVVLGSLVYLAASAAIRWRAPALPRFHRLALFHAAALLIAFCICGFFLYALGEYLLYGVSEKFTEKGTVWVSYSPLILGYMLLNSILPDALDLRLPNTLNTFLGVIPVLAILKVFPRPPKKLIPVVAILVFELLLLASFPGLKHIPLVKTMHNEFTFCLIFTPAAILAGWGFDRYCLQDKWQRRDFTVFVLLAAFMASLYFILDGRKISPRDGFLAFTLHIDPWLGITALILFFLFFSVRRQKLRPWFSYLAIGVALAQFYPMVQQNIFYSRPFDYEAAPALKAIKRDRGLYRVKGFQGANNLPNSGMLTGLYEFNANEPVTVPGYLQITRHLGIRETSSYSRLLDIAGVKYFIQSNFPTSTCYNLYDDFYRGLNENEKSLWSFMFNLSPKALFNPMDLSDNSKLRLIYRDRFCSIYENRDCLPLAFIASRIEPVSSGSEQEAIAALENNSADPRYIAFVEYRDAANRDRLLAAAGAPFAARDAAIVSYEPQRVEVKTSAPNPALLVLTDTFYPGWRVFVDQKEDNIFKVNLMFKGVIVPAGEHRVVFRYRPWPIISLFYLAVIVTVGAVGWLLFFSVRNLIYHGKNPTAPSALKN